MNIKNIFIIMLVLFITLGISSVSAESILNDNSTTLTEEANEEVSVETQEVSLDTYDEQIVNNAISDNSTGNATGNSTGNATTLKDTEIIAEDLVFKVGDNMTYGVILLSNGTPVANQTVSFYINGIFNSTVITDANGTATLDVSSLKIGKYVLTIKYNATSKYNSSVAESIINIFNTVVANDLVIYYKNGTKYIATFYDLNGTPIAKKVVSVTINGVSYNRTTDANGTIRFDINLNPNTYVITVKNPVTNEVFKNNVTVLPVITGGDIELYYRNGTQYEIVVLDNHGNPLNGTKIQLNINGVIYNRTTKANGSAVLNINLNPGKYVITAVKLDNGAILSNNITVLPVISAKNVELYYRNGTQYSVIFYDNHGNPLNGTKVRLNINGVFYNRTTNVNGSAVLNINLNPGKYVITAINPSNGAMLANNITVLSTISASNFKTTFQTGGRFNFTVLDKQGKPLAGQNVTLNINGVFYNRTTNANGSASLAINLMPGNYICTVTANGLSQAYNVTVDKRTPEIEFVSTTIKQNDPLQCKITYNKKPVEGAIIYFIVDTTEGQKYAGSYSNADGIANLRLIGFAKGSYQVYAGTQDNPIYSNLMKGVSVTIV